MIHVKYLMLFKKKIFLSSIMKGIESKIREDQWSVFNDLNAIYTLYLFFFNY